ncbi:hypothetical protein POM88_041453 [Heracleum sosnowskyi]|uniref:WAT1-related protein n=1 Tax=Heracleum sosnowskyi TaxID=360622 RepID=A0AAD8HGT6_9APIA|nr:hypothetical protein POM88_041453 [Heracleum sosnowskyi]
MLPAMTFVMAFLCRMEILDMKKIRCQAKVLGTALTVAGAMLMTLYKGKVVEMIWSSHIHPLKSTTPGTPVDTDKDRVKGSILLIIATFAWPSFLHHSVTERDNETIHSSPVTHITCVLHGPLMMIIVAIMGSFILAEKIFLGGVLGAVLIVIGLAGTRFLRSRTPNSSSGSPAK